MDETRSGWVTFAGVLLLILGTLNIIYGIAAIDDASFFVNDTKFIISDLQTWGWVALIVGVLEVFAAFSLWSGGTYGRLVGIVVASLGAIAALLSIPAYPFWSLAIFAVSVVIVHQIAVNGTAGRVTPPDRPGGAV
jgi:uncharacterized membrane protein HdeD (DUF308 family)